MHAVTANPQSASSVRLPALAARPLQPLPKLQLSIVDGIVSVTQQHWVVSDQCAHGFSSDAA
jgi:hypothetical protein